MARLRTRLHYLVPLVLLGGTLTAQTAASRHQGLTRDIDSGAAVFTEIVAYGSNKSAAPDGECPKYDDFILSTKTSAATGEFELAIPTTVPGYVVTFCSAGYFPRVEPAQNARNGVRFRPEPIKLIKRGQGIGTYQNAVQQETRSFLSTMRYLQQSDRGLFLDALGALQTKAATDDEKALLDLVRKIVSSGGA